MISPTDLVTDPPGHLPALLVVHSAALLLGHAAAASTSCTWQTYYSGGHYDQTPHRDWTLHLCTQRTPRTRSWRIPLSRTGDQQPTSATSWSSRTLHLQTLLSLLLPEGSH